MIYKTDERDLCVLNSLRIHTLKILNLKKKYCKLFILSQNNTIKQVLTFRVRLKFHCKNVNFEFTLQFDLL